MGHWTESSSSSMIKSLVFLPILALAFAEPEPKPEADPWLYYSHYAPAPLHYYPYHVGGYYYGKRSAEAEPAAEAKADPYYLYHGYYPYHGLSYYHGAVGGYYYGKRSAEAEPAAEAKADPFYLYHGYYPYYAPGL